MSINNGGNIYLSSSVVGAVISFSSIQQFVSIIAGITAIGSGLMAIRYYYIKSK